MRKTVVKCVCHRMSFRELKEIAEEQGFSNSAEIVTAGYCSGGCGMCRPYIDKMMVTGETEFVPGDFYIHDEQ